MPLSQVFRQTLADAIEAAKRQRLDCVFPEHFLGRLPHDLEVKERFATAPNLQGQLSTVGLLAEQHCATRHIDHRNPELYRDPNYSPALHKSLARTLSRLEAEPEQRTAFDALLAMAGSEFAGTKANSILVAHGLGQSSLATMSSDTIGKLAFLSHCEEDKPRLKEFAAELSRHIRLFVDDKQRFGLSEAEYAGRINQIDPGEPFGAAVDRAKRDCDCMIGIYSPSLLKKPKSGALDEMRYAMKREKLIIILDGVSPDDVVFGMGEMQKLLMDPTKIDRDAMRPLLDGIRKLLDRRRSNTAPSS